MEVLLTTVAVLLACVIALYALSGYLSIVVPVLALLVLYLLAALWKRKYDRRADEELALAADEAAAVLRAEVEKAEARKRARVRGIADEFLRTARSLLTPCLVIDSHIWMSEAYEPFFAALRVLCTQANYVLPMCRSQFDEIAAYRPPAEQRDSRKADSRLAIGRIEELQKLGLLRIEPRPVDLPDGDASEPLIVRIMAAWAARGNLCTYISDDKELRIRVREHLSRDATAQWQVVEMEQIVPQCRAVVEALRYRDPGSPPLPVC